LRAKTMIEEELIVGMIKQDNGWRVLDRLWAQMEPILSPRKPRPQCCHNLHVSDATSTDGILFVLLANGHWNALNNTDFCYSSAAH
jgi:hypothetical protein